MKNNLIFLKWLFNRRKAKSFKIPEGGIAIVLPNNEQYLKLIDGLADGETLTGRNYSKILTSHKTQVLTN